MLKRSTAHKRRERLQVMQLASTRSHVPSGAVARLKLEVTVPGQVQQATCAPDMFNAVAPDLVRRWNSVLAFGGHRRRDQFPTFRLLSIATVPITLANLTTLAGRLTEEAAT